MKVTIATGLYPPEIGGPATYSSFIEGGLLSVGHSVVVIPFSSVRKYPKLIRHIIFGWKIWKESKESDIVLALDPVSVGLPALIASKVRGKFFILRVPGDYAWEQGQLRFGVKERLHDFIEKRFEHGFFVSLLCYIESYVANRASAIIVPSNYLKNIVSKWGVSGENIFVIHSALNPLEVTENKEVVRKKLGFDSPTILSVGRLVPNKGFLELVDIFSEVKKAVPDSNLIIVGEGPLRNEIEDFINEKGLNNSINILGSKSKEDLGRIIKASDLFVLNTAHEGLSHQLLEVMSLGVPVLTTNVGGNPEIVENGVTGYVVDYGDFDAMKDNIINILSKINDQKDMTKAASDFVKKFSQEKALLETESLLKRYVR